MATRELNSVKELMFWSYANLAMAHTAVERKQEKYSRFNYMIRARLFKGLMNGTLNVRSIFDDEKIKIHSGNCCNYCGCPDNLALDHIFPQKLGGEDSGENLVFACRSCNSSKGKKDLMEWMEYQGVFPPLMILRRYLKLTIAFCLENDMMDLSVEDAKNNPTPFSLAHIPTKYPHPNILRLVAAKPSEQLEPETNR